MKKIKMLLAGLAVLLTANTFAQDASTGPKFSIGVEAALPVGKDLSDFYSFGIGGSAKAAFNIFEGGDVTVSAGYISFMGKTVGGFKYAALSTIPLKAGLRFALGSGFYGEPQLGYTIAKQSGATGNYNGFTYAAGVGYLVNQIDIGVRYEAWSKSEAGESISPSFIGLRAAYAF